MKKKEIIKNSRDFSKIINKRANVFNKCYSIYYIKANDTKYGITVPTKIGCAVVRNKLKRQIKNIIDDNQNNITKGYCYVIIIRKGILNHSFQNMEYELLYLFKMIGETNEKK